MKKYKRYSAGFKEQALVKVYSRGNDQSIQSVADELNINLTTLKTWMKQSDPNVNKPAQPKSKRPEDWSPEERLAALQQTYRLLGEDLNSWCRERGVFVHQLERWKTDFCSQGDSGDPREEARVLRALKVKNQSLERELLRKDKALAEAAALLVLQKSSERSWGRGRMTSHEERKQVIALLNESITAGVRQVKACEVLVVCQA